MTTPARRQYLQIKKENQDAILLFRMGDFYETFDEDARKVSRILEIALTSREMGKGHRVPLAGIPYHALETYLSKLIANGYKVAICEQTSDPSVSRGLVDREVVRVVTRGTVVEDSLLDQNTNNYLAAVTVEGDEAGLAFVDITTSEFCTSQIPLSHLSMELGRLAPSEILVPMGQTSFPVQEGITLTPLESEFFHIDSARETLLRQFSAVSLEPYGCHHLLLATRASGAILDYLDTNHKSVLSQINSLHTYSISSYMVLDTQTRRNLELFDGGRWKSENASLLSVLDGTKTSMGGRLLKKWIGQPLLNVQDIVRRQNSVNWFYRSTFRRGTIVGLLKSVSDIERLVNRVCNSRATPRDLVGLAKSLEVVPEIKHLLGDGDDAGQVSWLSEDLCENTEVLQIIRRAINDDPPQTVGDGKVIKQGFSPDLDSIRSVSLGAQEFIASLERTERDRTGIKSLKVGFNRVFGYYIEVSKSNLSYVPEEYIRRQTLVGGERFITPEMKEYESRILNAQDRIEDIEQDLFRQVCQQIEGSVITVIKTARSIAQLDVLCSLAEVASRDGYVKPTLNDDDLIDIKLGRHPVVDSMLPPSSFVPNDTKLSNIDQQLIILTGPNMSGKSTYLRQVALIVLMAQIGSFVPAQSATIGIVDRIFTRVGLQDDLSEGQSTFMVEMLEAAGILNQASSRSLIVLDEIGRGTSTYDGLAIARAVAEHIHNHPDLGCKTLFATHYHELTQLEESLPRVRNYNFAVSENQGDVVFLRRIVPGGADRSYGVHVARLAGLPASVINRAWEVLKELENGEHHAKNPMVMAQPAKQLCLDYTNPAALEELLTLDVSSITPMEAINKLYQLQEKARGTDQIV